MLVLTLLDHWCEWDSSRVLSAMNVTGSIGLARSVAPPWIRTTRTSQKLNPVPEQFVVSILSSDTNKSEVPAARENVVIAPGKSTKAVEVVEWGTLSVLTRIEMPLVPESK